MFDGYSEDPTTKDVEQRRRTAGKKKTSAEIYVKENMYVASNREIFLSNTRNKSQFLELLSKNIMLNGQQVFQSRADADTLITHTVLSIVNQGREARRNADDTDDFVLLLLHWSKEMAPILFHSEKSENIWSVSLSSERIQEELSSRLLLLHAWTGCDATSVVYSLLCWKSFTCKKDFEIKKLQELEETISDI